MPASVLIVISMALKAWHIRFVMIFSTNLIALEFHHRLKTDNFASVIV